MCVERLEMKRLGAGCKLGVPLYRQLREAAAGIEVCPIQVYRFVFRERILNFVIDTDTFKPAFNVQNYDAIGMVNERPVSGFPVLVSSR